MEKMSKLSKRAILTFIIAIFLIGMIPIIPVMADLPTGWTLEVKSDATVGWSTAQSKTGPYSVHMYTNTTTDGDEARIVIPMPDGFTLGDLDTISWWEYLVAGYPPHVDVYLDIVEGGTDELVFEYAYNDMTHYDDEAPAPYGAKTGSWYRTFSDDGKGPAQITNSSVAWLNSGSSGPDAWVNYTLADWKDGVTVFAGMIDADSIVLKLEIEIDNWIVVTEAFIDDIEINGVTYPLETDLPEGLGFSIDYVSQSTVYYGDVRL